MKQIALLFLLGFALTRAAENPAERVVIIANSRQPESVALARFYAEQRGVPETNIVALPLPTDESITWRQFIDQVWQPVQDELCRRGWLQGTATSLLDRLGRRRYAFQEMRLSYLVTCRGVPLRIYNDPTLAGERPGRKIPEGFRRNESAVDSELSLLAQSDYDINAFVGNPLFNARLPESLDAQMIVKVSRLDGPTWESARRLVSSALEAERTGLNGRYYIDLGGRNPEGDRWLKAAQQQLEEIGFEGDVDTASETFAVDARFDAPVFYFGWYAANADGPVTREGFAFPPGAIALHIHSYSAQTLRSDHSGWCGPPVARGAAVTMGNVFEPYLDFTHRPDLLLRKLRQGANLGDAAYYALPVLSWQAVLIGDPLYCPFKTSGSNRLKATPATAR